MTQRLQEFIDSILEPYRRSDAPGGVVALAHHGRVVYRSAFGLANVEHGVANTMGTRMPIASVTKHITCAALLQLASEGRLSLDDTMGQWMPELPAAQQRPTLRQLMTHTGGIRCYLDHAVFNGYATMPVGMPMTIQQRQVGTNFEPGIGSTYCNGGYLLLSQVVELASGESMEGCLRDRIFGPVGMRATELPRTRWPLQHGVATTYLPAEASGRRGWRHGITLSEEMLGDGGIVSTADDLLRWASHLRRSAGPVSLSALAEPARLANGWTSSYGFGLITERWRGVTIVNHAGGLPGASTSLVMLPDEGIDLVMLFNCNAPLQDLGRKILEAVLADRLEPPLPPPSAERYRVLIGQYLASDTGMMLGFANLDGVLGLSLFGGAAFPLESRDPATGELPFGADVGTGEMRFRVASDKAAGSAIEYLDAGAWRLATRLVDARPSMTHLTAGAEGEYQSAEAGATLSFEIDRGELVINLRGEYGGARCSTEILGPDLLRFWPTQFPGGMLCRFQRDSGAVTEVIVSTGRTRHTVFTRRSPGQ